MSGGLRRLLGGRLRAPSGRKARACAMHAGENLARVLNDAIDEAETEDRPRSEIIEEMGESAGISSGTVNAILNGEIDCPPLDRLEGFAEVLDISIETIVEAAESDGCDYGADDEEDGEEAAAPSRKPRTTESTMKLGLSRIRRRKGGTRLEDPIRAQDEDDEEDEDGTNAPKAQDEDEDEEEMKAAEHDEDDDAPASKAAAKAEKKAARKMRLYARAVADLCTLAGKPELAAEFIAKSVSTADVRKTLLGQRASASSAAEIAGHTGPDSDRTTAALWDKAVARTNARFSPGTSP